MYTNGTDKKAIYIFLLITFAMSGICYFIRINGGDAAAGMTSILMWCPGIAAFITQRIYYHHQKILGFHKCKSRYNLAAFLIPVIYLGISYGIFLWIDKDSFSGQLYTTSIPTLLLLLPSSFITAMGEEIGWRGLLLPKMSEVWNVKIAVVLSGAIWAAWHFPLMLAGLYQTGTPVWYQLTMFTVEIIAITGILAFLRLKSKSVWPAAILHTSHNYFDQIIFSPLANSEKSAYFVGETGIITIVVLVLIVIILMVKHKPSVKV